MPDRLPFLDEPERAFLEAREIKVFRPEELSAGAADSIFGDSASPVFVHFDLDVFDPGELLNVKEPLKPGITIEEAGTFLDRLVLGRQIVGLSLLENFETEPKRLARLRRFVDLVLPGGRRSRPGGVH